MTAKLVAYHEAQVRTILCTWTPERLMRAIQYDEPFWAALSGEERNTAFSIAHEWMQRALGHVFLRDAIWVDLPRGIRIYTILCNAFSVGHCPLPQRDIDLSRWCGITLTPREAQALVQTMDGGNTDLHATLPPSSVPASPGVTPAAPEYPPEHQKLVRLIEQARTQGWTLACYEGDHPSYPFPDDLDSLLPPPPPPYVDPASRFRPPSGWRRTLAFSLVIMGVLVLGVPLLMGRVPVQPAGLPLGLLTLGLLVGIRAGWFGYLGGGGVWLIANLPAFHHNAETTWGLLPLLLAGLFLMALDKHVRILWHWIWLRKREIGNETDRD